MGRSEKIFSHDRRKEKDNVRKGAGLYKRTALNEAPEERFSMYIYKYDMRLYKYSAYQRC